VASVPAANRLVAEVPNRPLLRWMVADSNRPVWGAPPGEPISSAGSLKEVQMLSSRARTVGVIMFGTQLMVHMCATGILCSRGLLAQTIFKDIDAAGRTTFADRPAAGLVVPRETLPGQERPRIASGTRADVAEALASNSRMSSMYAADIDFNEATRRLWQARANRQEGVEPRAGEWADNAGAMNQRYQRRQKRLEREVVAAERRSRETSLVRGVLLGHALSGTDAKTDPHKLAQP
jgi:hypothetical protein